MSTIPPKDSPGDCAAVALAEVQLIMTPQERMLAVPRLYRPDAQKPSVKEKE